MTTFNLINDPKVLDRLIRKVHASEGKFDAVFHEAAYNCLHVIDASGNTGPLDRLYAKLTPVSKEALRLWAVKFGKCRWSAKSSAIIFDRKVQSTDFAGAADISPLAYRKAKSAPIAHTFNLATEIERLVKRAIKNNINGKPITLLEAARKAA